MSTNVVTGASILRARTVLQQADIFGIDSGPILCAPAVPGKSLALVDCILQYDYGTTTYTTTGASAELRYGNTSGGSEPLGTTELITALISAKTVSQYKTAVPASVAAVALSTVQGLGIYLVGIASGFAASGGNGSVIIDLLYQEV